MKQMKNEAIRIAKDIINRKRPNVQIKTVEDTIRTVTIKHARPYTVAIINNEYIGVAKYNPSDAKQGLPWKPTTGAYYALARAVDYLLRKL